MSDSRLTCSPGSNPHADQPNWRPAETIDEYLRNCREGLEQYSERRAAKLMGFSRIQLWRARMMAEIPEELFDRLVELRLGAKGLALIGQALATGKLTPDIETCPHCGGDVRVRHRVSPRAAKVVADWLAEREGGAA